MLFGIALCNRQQMAMLHGVALCNRQQMAMRLKIVGTIVTLKPVWLSLFLTCSFIEVEGLT
jgi:hypothetical protein